jgi:DNA processing protein
MEENLLFWLWLNSIKGIGPVTAKLLLRRFQEPEHLYKADEEELRTVTGVGEHKINLIMNARGLKEAKEELSNCKRLGIGILTFNSELYPEIAKVEVKAPILLYYRGSLTRSSTGVAIVGSRRCTEYGKRVAVEAAEFLATYNITVISGMAKGIDSYSHTACLNKGGQTIAFLGCGVDICYPAEHRELMKKIIHNGAVISEYPHSVKPAASNFPERNRLISAWSEKVLIVEASEKSGALITAKYAREQGRQLYSVPNNIYVRESGGTNRLIEQGANVYLKPQQLLPDKDNFLKNVENSTEINSPKDEFSLLEDKVISILSKKVMSITELLQELRDNKETVIELLSIMELEGKIKSVAGGKLTARA